MPAHRTSPLGPTNASSCVSMQHRRLRGFAACGRDLYEPRREPERSKQAEIAYLSEAGRLQDGFLFRVLERATEVRRGFTLAEISCEAVAGNMFQVEMGAAPGGDFTTSFGGVAEDTFGVLLRLG